MSRVTCHMSCVMCHLSRVRFLIFFISLSGEASQGRVCYQRGLPRLVNLFKLFVFQLALFFLKGLKILFWRQYVETRN